MKKYLLFLIAFSVLSCASIETEESAPQKRTSDQASTEKTGAEGNFSLDLDKVDGGKFSFSEIKGRKHLLAAFWATWCEPCKTELKKLAEIYSEFSEHIEFVAVSTDSEDLIDKVNEFAVENAIPFPVLVDPSGNTVASIIPGGDSVPYSIIVHKNGTVISRHSGYKPGDELILKKELEELLKK